jgi:deoxyribodipyrimidine photo-lyase
MRELWATGIMHNRVRMIAASFLIKDLLVPWQEGERWFWDTLVDADIASNSASWQWVAGCGADAAPYFRIFNPVLQGEKFDHERRLCAQMGAGTARMPDEFVHKPWEAPASCFMPRELNWGGTTPILWSTTARRATRRWPH